ncbi:MAG: hypothetical protein M1835_002704 [Candelina submexicana]|nr:MAG: hypothetical protein M1835_002704 [Candelina submexicana]
MWSRAIFFFFPVVCFISTATAIPAARPQSPEKGNEQAGGYIIYGVVISSASLPITSTTPPATLPDTTYSTGPDLVKYIVSQYGPIAGNPFGGDASFEIVSTTPVTTQLSTSSSLPSSITSTLPQPSGAPLGSKNTPPTRSSSRSWNATSQQQNQSSFPTPTPSASRSSSSSSSSNIKSSDTSNSSNTSNSSSSFNNTITSSGISSSNNPTGYNNTITSPTTNSSTSSGGYNSTNSSNSTNSLSSNTTTSASSSTSPQPSVFVAPIQSSNSSSTQSEPTSTSATGTGTGSSTSSSTMNTASATSSVPAVPAPASTPASLSNSSIAGIAVGCTAAFALLVTALGYFFRRRYYANLARKQQTYPKLAYLYDPPGQPQSTHTASTARLRPSGDGGTLAGAGFDNNRYMGYESPRIPSLPPPTPTMARVGEGARGLGIETESTPFVGFDPPPPPPPGFIHDVEGQRPPHRHETQQSPLGQLQRSPEIGSSETTPFIATAPPAARRSTSPTLAGNSGSSSVKMEQREGTWWF